MEQNSIVVKNVTKKFDDFMLDGLMSRKSTN